ncbi:MAG TPA: Fe-S cluster assembly protein SufD [Herpetosiphonaceae bacterium]
MPANSTATLGALSAETFDAFAAGRQEPAWLAAARREAWAAFEAAGNPDWRRTNLKGLKLDTLSPAEPEVTVEFAGHQGVVVLPLAEALASHGELVKRVLGSGIASGRDRFAALNNALVSGGVFVYVPRNTEVEAPVTISYRLTQAGAIAAPRTLVLVEANSRIGIVEQYASDQLDGQALLLPGTEIVVGDNSLVRYASVQIVDSQVYVIGAQQFGLDGKDARGEWLNVVLGGAVQNLKLDAQMRGNGSAIEWNGVLYGNKKQNLLVAPTLNHVGLNTEGQINFKTVVDDESYCVFDGMVRIPKTGQGTNSDLRENAMHLSKASRSDSIPGLEIDANEVKAGHGSTSGQIDEEQLFYLQSRGLPFAEAKRIIVQGFVGEIIDRIPDETLREQVEELVAAKV